jgi:hypothetical protein
MRYMAYLGPTREPEEGKERVALADLSYVVEGKKTSRQAFQDGCREDGPFGVHDVVPQGVESRLNARFHRPEDEVEFAQRR